MPRIIVVVAFISFLILRTRNKLQEIKSGNFSWLAFELGGIAVLYLFINTALWLFIIFIRILDGMEKAIPFWILPFPF